MPLTPGTTLGVYEVTAAIGAGGMGEVYKARDTKLDRDVALKILPDAFVNDPERLARFQREAKVLASLNHPNIAQIHGLEESGDSPALVLEYVPGPTLQDRIAKGPIPLDEALPIARQIAEALEAAHEQGIIHRDLKPANVKVKDDGTVKVLDFGLAKALQPELSDLDAANSPTMTMTAAATKMGVIMGTAAYMSPEQARGKTVDKRADIWAFGIVLYEMLTGRQAFGGTDISLTLAAVLKTDLNLDALPDDTPLGLRRVLRRCIQKDRAQRSRDIGDVRLELDEALAAPVEDDETLATAPIAQPSVWQRPMSIAGIVLLAVVVTGIVVWSMTQPDPPLVVRMPIPLGANESFSNTGRNLVAISPDGSHIVYAANLGLSLRPVDQLEATPLAGTSEGSGVGVPGARNPFFSPDGQWVGYHVGDQLRKVSISGGAPITVGEIGTGIFGASWGADGTILFGQGAGGIWRVPGTGGTPEQVIAVEDGDLAYGPQALPGGEWVLFTLRPSGTSAWDAAQIVAASVTTGERQVLVEGGRDGRYVGTGHLVYALNNVLFAVPLDLETREVIGGPVSLVEGVQEATAGRSGAVHFSVADNGSLVYIPSGPGGGQESEMVWVNRSGQGEPVGAEPRRYARPRVSPDGTRVAVEIQDDNRDVWIYNLARETLTRLTFEDGSDRFPLWTPDGSRVVFQSDRDGGGLFWKAADGTGEVERLMESLNTPRPSSWTADGRLVFWQGPGGDIGVLAVEGDRTMELILDTDFNESAPVISPDGRWIAYVSNESGTSEIYARPFPNIDDGKWQVSASGGFTPVWSPDGRELFFDDGGLRMARVETEPAFNHATPELLFAVNEFEGVLNIAPDGERFLMLRSLGGQLIEGTESLIFVQNWFEELLERVPIP